MFTWDLDVAKKTTQESPLVSSMSLSAEAPTSAGSNQRTSARALFVGDTTALNHEVLEDRLDHLIGNWAYRGIASGFARH